MSSESSGGDLVVVSAPSGAGKTTVLRRLFSEFPRVTAGLAFSVSHTTRAPRPSEVDGRDYHFVDRATFQSMIDADRFLEWAMVHGQLKGTSMDEVERQRQGGDDVLLELDVQGADRVRQLKPEAISVFILPPSYEELERRLRARASDAPEQLAVRLRDARRELRQASLFDYVIVNQDLDDACQALANVLLARRLRRDRMQHQIDRVLDSLPTDDA